MEGGSTPSADTSQSRDRDSVDTQWYKGDEIGWFWAEKLPAPGHFGGRKWP